MEGGHRKERKLRPRCLREIDGKIRKNGKGKGSKAVIFL
jgi:hypothetical protein